MSAAAFILLALGLLGLLTLLYYAVACYPVIMEEMEKPSVRPYDPERKNLLPTHSDHNDNSSPSAPTTVPDDSLKRPLRDQSITKPKKVDAYPVLPNTSQPLNADHSFGGSAVPVAAAGFLKQNRIDEPDCATLPIRDSVKSKKLQKVPEQSEESERSPLLHGDDEDGLIVCQPSARSKNTGEPIPATGSPHVIVVVPETSENQPDEPIEIVVDTPKSVEPQEHTPSAPVDHIPSHIVLSMHQPIAVPPEVSMSMTHPPSHMIVTVAQPLNVPPLMVAPIYDEPPLEEQPTHSLQQQFHPIVTIPSDIAVSGSDEVKLPKDLNGDQPHNLANYGWREGSPTKENVVVSVTPEKVTETIVITTPVIVGHIVKTKSVSKKTVTTEVIESPVTSSNGSSPVSPALKDDQSDTDTSEGEVTEYTLQTAHLCPSNKIVLADEISSGSEVKIIRYTMINESVVMDADASVNESTRVHVGDPISDIEEADNYEQEKMDTEKGQNDTPTNKLEFTGPDLTIPRQSPDGDSLTSTDGENSSTPATSTEESSQKCKPPTVEPVQTSV